MLLGAVASKVERGFAKPTWVIANPTLGHLTAGGISCHTHVARLAYVRLRATACDCADSIESGLRRDVRTGVGLVTLSASNYLRIFSIKIEICEFDRNTCTVPVCIVNNCSRNTRYFIFCDTLTVCSGLIFNKRGIYLFQI